MALADPFLSLLGQVESLGSEVFYFSLPRSLPIKVVK